jgi:demethylmenaquinone methyltransferase/2-methoxy-6-polyprenyl-1,4-benzoquinol methylase
VTAKRPDLQAARFAARAGPEMAAMFDQVSSRYEWINVILSLGQVAAWRRAMWRAVPEGARAVLDLCSGNGASLAGLRRPGRLLIGADVSLGMLEAAAGHGRSGWAPRLLCADAFRLPLAGGSLDAVTVAFGMRNLRPRPEALEELARVLRPGGVLAVLEATAPRRGATAPLHRFYLRRVVPWVGRLSRDPSAYEYLSRSIAEFGSGPEFEADLEGAGFSLAGRRSFLGGAARLWIARRAGAAAQIASNPPPPLHPARPVPGPPLAGEQLAAEWRAWTIAQALTSAILLGALAVGAWTFANSGGPLPLAGWQRALAWILLLGGVVLFGIRTAVLIARLRAGPPP